LKKVEEYRQKAAECRALAERGPNSEVRGHYRALAEMWDKLATERMEFFVDNKSGTDS